MSPETTRTDTGADRYVQLETEDGSVVIYDVKNPTAWLQSDASVSCKTVA